MADLLSDIKGVNLDQWTETDTTGTAYCRDRGPDIEMGLKPPHRPIRIDVSARKGGRSELISRACVGHEMTEPYHR